ncbi:hypothetical protein B9Z55_022480 [Caenorhabditis nigoni]|uniref:COesterase domain-containing protein n=1 Tax=Caenorhabditis nigoni TaxID=1611254 RepID=A0A2G5SKH4_9PELO|nr:hypothetical protein B9Z55_022480 [Caenorhabditis nigoni]
MNYYALEVNTKEGIYPKMEKGFHEADVNFWFINMTAFDREVTRRKKLFNDSIWPRYPMHPGPVIFPHQPTEASPFYYDVSAQWWFYVLIVVVAMILFYIIYLLKRRFLKQRSLSETSLLLK